MLFRIGALLFGACSICAAPTRAFLFSSDSRQRNRFGTYMSSPKLGELGVEEQTISQGNFLSVPFDDLSKYLKNPIDAKLIWGKLRNGLNPLLSEDESKHYRKPKSLSPRARSMLKSLLGGQEEGEGEGQEDYQQITPLKVIHESVSSCGTTKMLLQLQSDHGEIESVLIPAPKYNRTTICVSTQIGCDRGCTFCLTGKMGLVRNLTATEILAQVYEGIGVAKRRNMPPLRNVVFMGMGDAGGNIVEVGLAVRCLTDQRRFNLSKQKVMVSTVGPHPAVFAQIAAMDCTIAWSLHSPDDAVRRLLVPTSRRYSVAELRAGLIEAIRQKTYAHLDAETTTTTTTITAPALVPGEAKNSGDSEGGKADEASASGANREQKVKGNKGLNKEVRGKGRRVTMMVALTLIEGVNDTPEGAHRVGQFLQPVVECAYPSPNLAVDLIPYNDIEAFAAASDNNPAAAATTTDNSKNNNNSITKGTETAAIAGTGTGFRRPRRSSVLAFQQIVRGYGLFCSVRVTRGDEESSACGMLATKSSKKCST